MNNSFSVEWLALRERFDLIARNQDIVQTVQRWQGRTSPLNVVDLGAGTGANFRILSPRLDGIQQWLLVDNDEQLLAEAGPSMEVWANRRGVDCEITGNQITVGRSRAQTMRADLVTDLETLPRDGVHLLTASALMDLVSVAWFERLATRQYPALYFVLSYNGHIDWHPSDAFDEPARQLINRHQSGDKGFGPAMGPGASEYIAETLRHRGYEIETNAADWRMQPSDATMQRMLLDNWAEAMRSLDPSETLEEWVERREALIDQQQSRLRVGHTDLFAWLPRH